MKKGVYYLFGLLMIASMLFTACAPAATETPAAEAPVEETAPTEAPAEAVAPTEAPTTEVAPTEAPTEAAPTGPSRLILVEPGNYTSLDPFTNAWHANPSYAVFATLWDYSLDLKEFGGILAESWEFAEDNLGVTVKLKEGITFTDGTPVNAEAIKWNIDKYLDPELASPGGGTMRDFIDSVDLIDDLTFKVNLKAPWAMFMDEFAGKEIASPTAYETLGAQEYANALTSAGPWIVKEIVPDVNIVYTKNEAYTYGNPFASNQGPVQFDELELKYINDEAVIYAALETGEIQWAALPAQYLEQARANPNIKIVEAEGTDTQYLGMNNQYYPFTEEGVRQAIAYAVNREELNLIAYEGAAIPLYQPLGKGNIGWNPAMEDYGKATSDDPEKAKAMLDELGFVDTDGDGIREEPADGPNGNKKMSYELMTPVDPTNQRMVETLQSQLAAIGIETHIMTVDSTLMRQKTAEGSHQMIYWGYAMTTPDITTYIFRSSRIGASNRNHVNDPYLDTLLDAQDQQLDPVLRQQATDEISKYLIDHRFHVPLLSPMYYYAYRADKIECAAWTIQGGCNWTDWTPVQ